jgi:hypothetical protein
MMSNTNKMNAGRKVTSKKTKVQQYALRNIRSFKDQPLAEHWIPQATSVLATTVGTGVIAVNIAAGAVVTNTTQWAARFGSTYEEYRTVKVCATFRFFSVLNPGLVCVWFEEKSAAAPTAASALEKAVMRLSASSSAKPMTIHWTARDYIDLDYSSTGTLESPVNLKIYTDTTNFGSNPVVTSYLQVEVKALVQFRGFQAV